ncbi:pyruvate decarboxylase [Tanacetum coccineum]
MGGSGLMVKGGDVFVCEVGGFGCCGVGLGGERFWVCYGFVDAEVVGVGRGWRWVEGASWGWGGGLRQVMVRVRREGLSALGGGIGVWVRVHRGRLGGWGSAWEWWGRGVGLRVACVGACGVELGGSSSRDVEARLLCGWRHNENYSINTDSFLKYGSIGWSVGAALGYAQALKYKHVIACIGDGSFQLICTTSLDQVTAITSNESKFTS